MILEIIENKESTLIKKILSFLPFNFVYKLIAVTKTLHNFIFNTFNDDDATQFLKQIFNKDWIALKTHNSKSIVFGSICYNQMKMFVSL